MTTKNADTLKREREALRDATARKIEALVDIYLGGLTCEALGLCP